MDERQIKRPQQKLPISRPPGMAASAKEIVAFDMEPLKKDARSFLTFKDAQAAIDGALEAWLPRLVESNEALEEALLLLRDLHFARQSVAEEVVLERVQDALNKAASVKGAF
jgi:hypothetical protein